MAVNPMQYTPQIVGANSNVIMLNSPFYASLTSGSTFTHIRLKLWVWTGDLAIPFDNQDEPNVILYKQKVNPTDTFIQFEIADYVKDLFNPTFVYNNTSTPTTSNTTVFFKYEYDIINNPNNLDEITVLDTVTSSTYLGTQGWLWDYESIINSLNEKNGSFGFYQIDLPTNYKNPKIKYSSFEYDLDATNTESTIISTVTAPTLEEEVCPKEGWLIVYINKEGRWDYFTPTGKSVIRNSSKKEKYTKTFRNPLNFVNSRDHQVKQYNTTVETTIVLNTGNISELAGQYIEEILYSPVVYLIEFKSLVNLSGFYNNWVTRPVIITGSDFERKTRINNKGKINYNIKFETTTNKVKNIR